MTGQAIKLIPLPHPVSSKTMISATPCSTPQYLIQRNKLSAPFAQMRF